MTASEQSMLRAIALVDVASKPSLEKSFKSNKSRYNTGLLLFLGRIYHYVRKQNTHIICKICNSTNDRLAIQFHLCYCRWNFHWQPVRTRCNGCGGYICSLCRNIDLAISLSHSIVWPAILTSLLPLVFGNEVIWLCHSLSEGITAYTAFILLMRCKR